jgi:CO/xanthine dehydrogenase FAD-binding subunit
MKPAPFEYLAPGTLEEAIDLLARHGDAAKLIAGGQSLGPLLNMRLARPEVLIDLNRLSELDYLREQDGWLAIGALTRQRTLERSPLVRERWPLLHEAVPCIGHLAIRNRGTVGGSIAHADPSAELPSVVTALGGELRIRGPRGERSTRPEEFFVTYLTTTLEPDEVLVEVRLPPVAAGTGAAWLEYARRHGDFALVGVAALLRLGTDGRCAEARLVYTGVGPAPYDARPAAGLLIGQPPSEETFAAAAERAAADSEPDADLHASAEYRRHLVWALTRRALRQALQRAQGRLDGA